MIKRWRERREARKAARRSFPPPGMHLVQRDFNDNVEDPEVIYRDLLKRKAQRHPVRAFFRWLGMKMSANKNYGYRRMAFALLHITLYLLAIDIGFEHLDVAMAGFHGMAMVFHLMSPVRA